MPPSRYPTIADGTLVPDTAAAMGFPAIPGRPSPVNLSIRCSTTISDRTSTTRTPPAFSTAVPKVKRSLPQLVVKVDADGNEVAGVKSPLQRRRSAPTPGGT